jgi:hypothetical protein
MTPMPRPRPQRVKHRSNSLFFYASRAIAAMLVMGAMAAIGLLILVTLAQDPNETQSAATTNSTPAPYAAYFVAPDSDGIQQVWGLTLPDGQSKLLTQAPQSVFHFALSADHTQIVYVSDNQIWRQMLGQSNAESLVYVSGNPNFATLALSPDGQWLAYRNHGLWMMDLATKKSQELLADFPQEENALNVPGLRRYSPIEFLDNERLMVNIGMWETTTRGIYFLSTQTMQEVAGQYGMLELMPLADGRYLAYSETRVGLGIDGFLIGQPAADPLEPFLLTPILSEVFAAHQLAGVTITNAIESAPGQLRFIGTSFTQVNPHNPFEIFMGTYDFNTNAFTVDSSQETRDLLAQAASIHGMSPDGRYVAGHLNTEWVETGLQYSLAVVDLETRTPIVLTAPSPARYFEWANRK